MKNLELVSNNSVTKDHIVLNRKDYVNSDKYGTLLGTTVSYKDKHIVFCPMEISVHVMEMVEKENEETGKSIFNFYMDNDEVIDMPIYHAFINDELKQDQLEKIFIKNIIPFMEKKAVL